MGETFSDNSRYLYQHLHNNLPDYNLKKIIWVTRNDCVYQELKEQGYTVCKMHSIKSYYFHLKSGYHFVSNVPYKTKKFKGDILGELSFGATKFQLWHGIPLKGIGKTSVNSKKSLFKKNIFYDHFVRTGGGWDEYYLLATSDEVKEKFSDSFAIDDNKIIVSSYPRNCTCEEYLKSEQEIIDYLNTFKKVILYAPTFRESANKNFIHPLESEQFVNYLEKNEKILWIEKHHSADEAQVDVISHVSNILYLDSNFDLNLIVPNVDVLVTDYSSISFDALFFDKTVVYYIPDLSIYETKERGFTFPFYSATYGVYCFTIDNLKEIIDTPIDQLTYEGNANVISLVYDNTDTSYKKIINDLGII